MWRRRTCRHTAQRYTLNVMKQPKYLALKILLILLPTTAYAHGEQIFILVYSDLAFITLAFICLLFVKFKYASNLLIFILLVFLTVVKYLLPFPHYMFLLDESLIMKVIAVVIHIFPTIIICWIAIIVLKKYKFKKGIEP